MNNKDFKDTLKVPTVEAIIENITSFHIKQCSIIIGQLSENTNFDLDDFYFAIKKMKDHINDSIVSLEKLLKQSDNKSQNIIQNALDYAEDFRGIIEDLSINPDNFNHHRSYMDQYINDVYSSLNELLQITNQNSENTHSNPNSHKTQQSPEEGKSDISEFC